MFPSLQEYNEFCAQIRDLEQLSEDTKLTWSASARIGPFKERDFVTRVHYRTLPDGTRLVANRAENSSCAPSLPLPVQTGRASLPGPVQTGHASLPGLVQTGRAFPPAPYQSDAPLLCSLNPPARVLQVRACLRQVPADGDVRRGQRDRARARLAEPHPLHGASRAPRPVRKMRSKTTPRNRGRRRAAPRTRAARAWAARRESPPTFQELLLRASVIRRRV